MPTDLFFCSSFHFLFPSAAKQGFAAFYPFEGCKAFLFPKETARLSFFIFRRKMKKQSLALLKERKREQGS